MPKFEEIAHKGRCDVCGKQTDVAVCASSCGPISLAYCRRGRMEEAGIRNMSAYIRKMALNGYILHVDLSPVQELVSLQRRCANNLNQVATHANSYGVYQEEIKALQRDYAKLWGPLSDLLQKLSEVVRL